MRVDEGRKGWNINILAINTKACVVVGRGEKSLLSDAESATTSREGEDEERKARR